ncbi:hypothetical protein C8034_v005559 [Colletotrichum sidae]|uniref:F-box domain-containing protein n=1 Tax=Colletotrichum sidae TaxID=1347389 RepID=A0A4R8T6V6_9PEZI|nr:hypothetical protein C8034_v005559 [Colletotrichum sidae]
MKPFLPTEILDHIGQVAVPSWSTLRNLTLVDRRFYAVFTHCLYEAAVAEHHPGPTCCAASTGNLAALKLAAKHGANFDAIYPQGIAGKEYDIQRAKRLSLLPRKVSDETYERREERSGTPLHAAIFAGQVDVVKWLIAERVDLELPGQMDCGCRHFPCIDKWYEMCQSDYAIGSASSLHYAICQGETAIAHLLLSAGADPRAWTRDSHRGQRATKRTISALATAIATGERSIVTRLVRDHGNDLNAYVGEPVAAACYAAVAPDSTMVQLVYSLGGNVSAAPATGSNVWRVFGNLVRKAFETSRFANAIELMRLGSPLWFALDSGEWHSTLQHLDFEKSDDSKPPFELDKINMKRTAFIMLARKTMETVPADVPDDQIRDLRRAGLLHVEADGDYSILDIMAYLDIAGFSYFENISRKTAKRTSAGPLYPDDQCPERMFALFRCLTDRRNIILMGGWCEISLKTAREVMSWIFDFIRLPGSDDFVGRNSAELVDIVTRLGKQGIWHRDEDRKTPYYVCPEKFISWFLDGSASKLEAATKETIKDGMLLSLPREIQEKLGNLPMELLRMVGSHLDSFTGTLSSLSQVNRQFHAIYSSMLYKAAISTDPAFAVKAAEAGNLDALKVALEHEVDLNYLHSLPDSKKELKKKEVTRQAAENLRWGSPLCLAVVGGHLHVVEWLLAQGVNTEMPAHIAHKLLDANANIECFSDQQVDLYPGLTHIRLQFRKEGFHDWNRDIEALHIAAAKGNRSIVSRLMSKHQERYYGQIEPLWYAFYSPGPSMMRLFLELGITAGYGPRILRGWPRLTSQIINLRNFEAAVELLLHGWPVWWHFNEHEYREGPTSLLSDVGSQCPHYGFQLHGAHFGYKTRFFLLLVQRTVETVPSEVTEKKLHEDLARTFINLCSDVDFGPVHLAEYIDATNLRLDKNTIGLPTVRGDASRPPQPLGAMDMTNALNRTIRSRQRLAITASNESWGAYASIISFLLDRGASAERESIASTSVDTAPLEEFLLQLVEGGSGRVQDALDFADNIAQNILNVVKIIRALGSRGGFRNEDAIEYYGTLIGKSREHIHYPWVRDKLRKETIDCVPAELRDEVEKFSACIRTTVTCDSGGQQTEVTELSDDRETDIDDSVV